MHREFNRSSSLTNINSTKAAAAGDNTSTAQWLSHKLSLDVFKRICHRWIVKSKGKAKWMQRERLRKMSMSSKSDADSRDRVSEAESKHKRAETQRHGSTTVNKYLVDIMAGMDNTRKSNLPHFVVATFAKPPKQRSQLDLDGALAPVRSQSWIESLPPEATMKNEVMRELLRYLRLKVYPKGTVIESVCLPAMPHEKTL
eukprot:765988-Hanusia_phi.AAC.7